METANKIAENTITSNNRISL